MKNKQSFNRNRQIATISSIILVGGIFFSLSRYSPNTINVVQDCALFEEEMCQARSACVWSGKSCKNATPKPNSTNTNPSSNNTSKPNRPLCDRLSSLGLYLCQRPCNNVLFFDKKTRNMKHGESISTGYIKGGQEIFNSYEGSEEKTICDTYIDQTITCLDGTPKNSIRKTHDSCTDYITP
ncbi:MAG: hypothetical protein V1487_00645 [bacterium]